MPLTIWRIEEIETMIQVKTVHNDEDDEVKEVDDRGWGWWMVLPVVALSLIVYQISSAAMTSVFDEKEE
jgi:hypothetical protein